MEHKNNSKTENELRVITKAKELALHSYRITSNTDKFPKKYRHSIVDKIQNRCLDIQDRLFEANSISHGNCYKLGKALDKMFYGIIEKEMPPADGNQQNGKQI